MPLSALAAGKRKPQSMEQAASLSATWADFDELKARLVRYLKTSEEEFCSLIEALNACWDMTENMQKATGRLADTAEKSGSQTAGALNQAD